MPSKMDDARLCVYFTILVLVVRVNAELANLDAKPHVPPGTSGLFDLAKGTNVQVPSVAKGIFDSGRVGTHQTLPSRCEDFTLPNTEVKKEDGKLIFSCKHGYTKVSGDETRTCVEGGWSGNDLTCNVVNCGQVPKLKFGTSTGVTKTTYKSRVTYTVKCDKGFTFSGVKTAVCQVNGKWSELGSCKAKDCGAITWPSKFVTKSTQTTYPIKVTLECQNGYQLSGSATVHCQADGTWSTVGRCQAKDCGAIKWPTNSVKKSTPTTFPTQVTLVCQTGYQLKGPSTVQCQAGGTWSAIGQCQAVNCGPVPKVKYGTGKPDSTTKTTYRSRVTYTVNCDKGYVFSGTKTTECLATGKWSELKSCVEHTLVRGKDWWLLVPGVEDATSHRNTQVITEKCVKVTDGPGDLKAYTFPGSKSCYVRMINEDKKLSFRKSFTIALFVKQEVAQLGKILEWRGKTGNGKNYGTHLAIWGSKKQVFFNPDMKSGSHRFLDSAVCAKQWNFIGVSYDKNTGTLLMWNGANSAKVGVGKDDADTANDIYLGVRPHTKTFHPFRGSLAGVFLMDDVITEDQIPVLKGLLVREPHLKAPNPGWWLLVPGNLAASSHHGLKVTKNPIQGPYKCKKPVGVSKNGHAGLSAWSFPNVGRASGHACVKLHNTGQLSFKSFTVAMYIWQDRLKDGPILEWFGKTASCGVHFWIYRGKLYANLKTDGGSSKFLWGKTPKLKTWNFVGLSYNRETGKALIWVGCDKSEVMVGTHDLDVAGDIYLGARPRQLKYYDSFAGKVSGVLMMNSAIGKDQIEDLKGMIRGTEEPITSPSWWLLMPGNANHPSHHGLKVTTNPTQGPYTCKVPVGVSTKGPAGLSAWSFPNVGRASGHACVKLHNTGQLSFKSFTIALYIWQDRLKDGPILEWFGKSWCCGVHFWIHHGKLYANLLTDGGSSKFVWGKAPKLKTWNFVGLSYNRETGKALIWVGCDKTEAMVGQHDLDVAGDIYFGLRAKLRKSYDSFAGKMSGVIMMSSAIGKEQIEVLEGILYRKEAVNCGLLPTMANAVVYNQDVTRYNVKATYKCRPGFALKGPNTSSCQWNGKWSPLGTCQAKPKSKCG